MNITLIREKYPKAIYRMLLWLDNARGFDKSLEGEAFDFIEDLPRELYNFFDLQGIYVGVKPQAYPSQKLVPIFDAYIICRDLTITPIIIDCVSRPEAEEQAFLKAFEILEDKL